MSRTGYSLDAVGLSGILKGKQNLGVTFNFNKQDIIDFTKFSCAGPQKQIHKSSRRSFVFWEKNCKGLLFYLLFIHFH